MVVGLKLDRWNVVERLVDSPIVEPVEVVEGLPFDVFDASPRTLAVNQLVLVETVERFGQGVVVRIAFESN